VNLVDCAEDHRFGALDRPAHRVPGAVAAMYLGEPSVGLYELAVQAGVMPQLVSTLEGHTAQARTPGLRLAALTVVQG
jgi:hypothetical protein